jgi:hypothetical protein
VAVRAARRVLASLSLSLGLGGLACNGSLRADPDAGPSGGGGGLGAGVALTGVHAYTVSSQVTTDPRSQTNPLAPDGNWTQSFKLVLDANAGLAVLGTTGQEDATPYQSSDGRTFAISGTFYVPLPDSPGSNNSCGPFDVEYGPMTITVASDGHLTGAGKGRVCASFADNDVCSDSTIVYSGGPDGDPPVLTIDGTGALVDPFLMGDIRASQPLPLGTRPTLLSTGGDEFMLAAPPPAGIAALDMFAASFPPPPRRLLYGDTYTILAYNVFNLVGKAATTSSQFQTLPDPPFVLPDGFESVTAASIGDALVISTGYPVITGIKSLYLPPQEHAAAQPRKLALRLGLPVGATRIAFTYRTVNVGTESPADLKFAWASFGEPIASMTLAPAQNPTSAQFPDLGTVALGPPTLVQLPLGAAADNHSEIVLDLIDSPVGACAPGPPVGPSTNRTGIIMDDVVVLQ